MCIFKVYKSYYMIGVDFGEGIDFMSIKNLLVLGKRDDLVSK